LTSRHLASIALFAVVFFTACGNYKSTDTVVISPTPTRPYLEVGGPLYSSQKASSEPTSSFAGVVTILNNSTRESQFEIGMDGYLFRNKDELLNYVASLPSIYPNEPNYQKAWRFLTARAYQYIPFTGSSAQEDPLLFINSLGYGLCDDFANVLARIWSWQGYESRVWLLNGHVVPEIQIDQQWEMFDGNYGVYYLDQSGHVASVNELSADPDLILDPINPILHTSSSAYSQELADIYGSTEDNISSGPSGPESRGMQVSLPAEGEFIFPVVSRASLLGSNEGAPMPRPLYYDAEIRIPYVVADTVLNLPLFMIGVSGIGQIEINGQVYDIGSEELATVFQKFGVSGNYQDPVKTVTLRGGSVNIVIAMSLTPFAIDGVMDARVRVYQDTETPQVEVRYSASANQVASSGAVYFAGLEEQLIQLPYAYISPVSVGSDVEQLFSPQTSDFAGRYRLEKNF